MGRRVIGAALVITAGVACVGCGVVGGGVGGVVVEGRRRRMVVIGGGVVWSGGVGGVVGGIVDGCGVVVVGVDWVACVACCIAVLLSCTRFSTCCWLDMRMSSSVLTSSQPDGRIFHSPSC